jgi:hypothetical protein
MWSLCIERRWYCATASSLRLLVRDTEDVGPAVVCHVDVSSEFQASLGISTSVKTSSIPLKSERKPQLAPREKVAMINPATAARGAPR